MTRLYKLGAVFFRKDVLIGAIALLIIGGYSFYAALPYLLGPSLSTTQRTENGITIVSGMTARVSFLSINDAPVPLEEDGSFSVQRAYPLGYTDIKVSVKDRFGRTLTKMISFLNN